MICIADNLWIGTSHDIARPDELFRVKALLNVARDLPGIYGWENKLEYMQVGLIDGPGNEIAGYCTAILSLVTLLRRNKTVLVYDHDGCIALVVGMMYLNLIRGQYRHDPLSWSHWLTWDERLHEIRRHTKTELPQPNLVHIKAFSKIPYGVLEALLRD